MKRALHFKMKSDVPLGMFTFVPTLDQILSVSSSIPEIDVWLSERKAKFYCCTIVTAESTFDAPGYVFAMEDETLLMEFKMRWC